jgi:hypothetical protein
VYSIFNICDIVNVFEVYKIGIVNVEIVAWTFKDFEKAESEVTRIEPFDNNYIGDVPL